MIPWQCHHVIVWHFRQSVIDFFTQNFAPTLTNESSKKEHWPQYANLCKIIIVKFKFIPWQCHNVIAWHFRQNVIDFFTQYFAPMSTNEQSKNGTDNNGARERALTSLTPREWRGTKMLRNFYCSRAKKKEKVIYFDNMFLMILRIECKHNCIETEI